MLLKDRLRKLLDEKNIKPAELARLSGVSEAMLSYYLSGKREPMGKTCFKLANALNVSIDELLGTPFSDEQKEKTSSKTTEKAFVNMYIETFGHEPSTDDIEKAISLLRAAHEFNK